MGLESLDGIDIGLFKMETVEYSAQADGPWGMVNQLAEGGELGHGLACGSMCRGR